MKCKVIGFLWFVYKVLIGIEVKQILEIPWEKENSIRVSLECLIGFNKILYF